MLTYANALTGVSAVRIKQDRTLATQSPIIVFCRGLATNANIANGTKVVCIWLDSRWEIIGEYC